MRRPWSPSSDPSVEAVDFTEYQRAIAYAHPYDPAHAHTHDSLTDDHYDLRYDHDYPDVVSPLPRHAPAPFSPPLSPPAMTVTSHSSADSYGGMSSFATASNPSAPPGAAPRQHAPDPSAHPASPYRRAASPPAEIDITNVGRQPFSRPAHITHYYPDSEFAPPSPYLAARFNASHVSHRYSDPFASRPSLADSHSSRASHNP
ncbi:hypothetical protein HDZ31DRAFT_69696, partial [Schizophyllum fasciatum]